MSQQYANKQPAGFKNRINNVAIVGATGTVGKFITEALLATGKHTVTAITREDSKTQVQNGVKTAKINYDDPSTLVNALKGQDFLVITLPTTAVKGTQEKLVDAAADAGVHWIMPNEYSPDFATQPEFGKRSLLGPPLVAIREYINSKGLNYVALTSGFWYQYSMIFSPEAYGFDFQNKTVTLIDDGEAKISTSTWEQSGRAVASALSLPILPGNPRDENKGQYLDHFKNSAVYCHSFQISQRDMLASILRVTGDKESDWTIKYEPAEERYARGMNDMQSGNRIGFATVLYTPTFSRGGAGDITNRSNNDALGLPKEDLDEATNVAIDMVKSGWKYHGA